TPGFLISALHLLTTDPDPSRETIRAELSGNICRCTGYTGIVDAVRQAAAPLQEAALQEAAPKDAGPGEPAGTPWGDSPHPISQRPARTAAGAGSCPNASAGAPR